MNICNSFTCARLSVDKVVWTEKVSVWWLSHRVHGSWLQVDKDSAWHIFTAIRLVVVHIDAIQLQIVIAVVMTVGVNAMLIGNDLPELELMEIEFRKKSFSAYFLSLQNSKSF